MANRSNVSMFHIMYLAAIFVTDISIQHRYCKLCLFLVCMNLEKYHKLFCSKILNCLTLKIDVVC